MVAPDRSAIPIRTLASLLSTCRPFSAREPSHHVQRQGLRERRYQHLDA